VFAEQTRVATDGGKPKSCAGTPEAHIGYLPVIREVFMRSILLWAIGIPLPIIIILWLVTGHA
jgi:hypothetical protein